VLPIAAADEAERAVKELNMSAVVIGTNVRQESGHARVSAVFRPHQ
jgi:hypothetical protein